MKKIILIVITLLAINDSLFSQTYTSVFTYNESGNIVPNSRFVTPTDNSLSSLPFSMKSVNKITVDSATYEIKTGRFKNWENEPGDFDLIQFYKNNQLIYTYRDGDGIVKLKNPGNQYSVKLGKYTDNDYFIEVPTLNNIKFIIFVGQHYGTDLSKLIIFAVTKNEVKLVYNQRVQINALSMADHNMSLIVQSNIPNENEVPILYEIRSEEGILKFRNVKK